LSGAYLLLNAASYNSKILRTHTHTRADHVQDMLGIMSIGVVLRK